jgi:hypothetical protein
MNDLLLDADFDLAVEGGDLVVGESSLQHQQLLLFLFPGELRQFPAVGVGVRDYLLDGQLAGAVNSAVKRSYEADGMKVRRIARAANGALKIDAIYE